MERNINSLIGYKMEATNGEIGKTEEFYFEDDSWKIKYIIVKTGGWLFFRKVLISPIALVKGDWKEGVFPVTITKEQVSDSPGIDTDKPVSRQQEIELYGHYAWQRYGGSGFYAGGTAEAMDFAPIIDETITKEADPTDKRSNDGLHLRSTQNVTGYNIHATDGEIGHVTDFIFDDQTWQILYFVVDTNNWLGGKKVLIKVKHVNKMEWDDSKVFVNVSIEDVKTSPLFEEPDYLHLQV